MIEHQRPLKIDTPISSGTDAAPLRSEGQLYLIGSQLHSFKPDSDWDFVLRDDSLLSQLPRPFPSDNPMLTQNGVIGFHRLHHDWSKTAWRALGGDSVIEALKGAVVEQAVSSYPLLTAENLDLLLYIPPEVSPNTWALRLKWSDLPAAKNFIIHEIMNQPDYDPDERVLKMARVSQISALKRADEIYKELELMRQNSGCKIPKSLERYSALGRIDRDMLLGTERLPDLTGLP